MGLANVCPDCLATDGDHYFDCEEVEHWDDYGTCAACGVAWKHHERENALIDLYDTDESIEHRHWVNKMRDIPPEED